LEIVFDTIKRHQEAIIKYKYTLMTTLFTNKLHHMDLQSIISTANAMMAKNKGLLAMDESIASCNKRFELLGIPATEEMRRAYRELIITTEGLNQYINGVILCDETIYQSKKDGIRFTEIIKEAGILIGIKVDMGLAAFENHIGEKITQGLDGLSERLVAYKAIGASFAKWRVEINIGNHIPSNECIVANAKSLALYAKMCQEEGLVPIVEPEVNMGGNHTLEKCLDVTHKVLVEVFNQLQMYHVALEAIILKPNMILPGLGSDTQVSIQEVANKTVHLLLDVVPSYVPGIAFLSGGQPFQLATARLNAMNFDFKEKLPWALTFSFSRAIQQPALETWLGNSENMEAAQAKLLHRAMCNAAARRGEYHGE